MPLLQFYCEKCMREIEEFAKPDEVVLCPLCKQPMRRSYSGKIQGSIGKEIKKCSGNCKSCKGC